MYSRFLEILRLSRCGLNGDEIGRQLHMNNVRKYLSGEKKSFLTHLRAEQDRLGPPRSGKTWLPLRLKPRGVPGESWIQVPRRIRRFEDLISTLDEVAPIEIAPELRAEFGYKNSEEVSKERIGLFGFFLGAAIGDAGKHRKGESKFVSKVITMELSKAKPNSFRFGEFTTLGAQVSLGLEMHRIADGLSSEHRFSKAETYRWISPASPLVSWVHHDCLGLGMEELTTYDPLKMDWLVDAPTGFKTSVFQGISESDGWVDAGADTVCIVSSPNTRLFTAVLESLGVRSRVDQQELVQIIRVPTEDAIKLPMFSARVNSVYFQQMLAMSRATRLPERVRLPDEVIRQIRELSLLHDSLAEICLNLAIKHGIKVGYGTVRKYLS